ncbi:hypothetical protein Tco_1224408 [Tanacetum coccineum]
MSNKESLEVEITKEKEVEIIKETLVVDITNVVILVNVTDEDEEITDEVYELKRREKGKIVEETRNSPIPTSIRSPRIHTNLRNNGNIQAQISTQIENAIANVIPSQVDASVHNQQYQLYLAMKADPQLQQQDIAIWLALHMKFERNTVSETACRTSTVRPRDQDDPHVDAHPEGENKEQAPSTSGNQEQDDDFIFWTGSYASDDDEIPTKQVSQDIMEEVSLTIDEVKLRKMPDEMLRQRCTSGDEHLPVTSQIEEKNETEAAVTTLWLSCKDVADSTVQGIGAITVSWLKIQEKVSYLQNKVLLLLAFGKRYLKKAQSEKPCLYEIPYDTSDPANRFAPEREETMTLDNESRSKLNKDYVKPYDYTNQNSLYEIFKGPSLEYLYQLERAKEVRKTMWRKPFVRTKPNIAKNI